MGRLRSISSGGIARHLLCLFFLSLFCQKSSSPKEGKSPPSQITLSFEMEESVSGSKLYRIYAQKALLYEDKGEIEVIEPRVYFFTNWQITSYLTAREGKVFTKTSDLVAKGGVMVATEDSIYLFTDSLVWNNSAQKIETDAPILIKSPRAVIEGEGLVSDAGLAKIIIKSEIKGKSDYEFK